MPVQRARPVAVREVVRSVWEREVGGAEGDLLVEGDAEVHAGPDVVRWILRHLLDNAASYGRPPVRVTITDGETATVRITSRAPELHPTDIELAFELFFRGEYAVMRSPGLGVGLPVARRLAEHAGGRVELAARSDEVTATLELPAS